MTVQSEEERSLLKQMRKEEKKINKLLTRTEEEEEEEFVFDPLDMRTKRQAGAIFGIKVVIKVETPIFLPNEAKYSSLVTGGAGQRHEHPAVQVMMMMMMMMKMMISMMMFRERQEARENTVVEQFPGVFDSMNKAKLTSGFITGTKMSLPVGFTRKDDKKWEEVTVIMIMMMRMTVDDTNANHTNYDNYDDDDTNDINDDDDEGDGAGGKQGDGAT